MIVIMPMLELFTIDEVAKTFRVSRRTMHEYLRRFPFYRRLNGRKLFTRSDIKALYEALECPSGSSDGKTETTTTYTEQSAASLSARAQVLLTKKLPKRSGRKGSGKSSKVVYLAQRPRPRS